MELIAQPWTKNLNHVVFVLIAISVSLCSCNNRSSEAPDAAKVKSVGSYDGNLESGLWKLVDQNNKVIEEGRFDSGVRIGRWQYNWPTHYSVVWNEFLSQTGKIRTNTPSFFTVFNNYDSLVFLKTCDTSKIFNLVIATSPLGSLNTNSEYEKQLLVDIHNLKINVVDVHSEGFTTTSGIRYLFDKISGNTVNSKNITIFNMVRFDSDSMMTEVSLRCEKEFLDVGQMSFYSIISNLFIKSERFIEKKDVIAKFF